jgi:hypothetical protein
VEINDETTEAPLPFKYAMSPVFFIPQQFYKKEAIYQ